MFRCVGMLGYFSQVWLCETLWTIAHQAPLSTESSRQKYWSGLLCPPPGDFPNPGIKPAFLLSPALVSRYCTTRQYIKKKRNYFTDKGPSSQSYDYFSSHVWMWELDYKEVWALKNWWFWTVVLEKTLENPLDCKEIKPVIPKGNIHIYMCVYIYIYIHTYIYTYIYTYTHREKLYNVAKDSKTRIEQEERIKMISIDTQILQKLIHNEAKFWSITSSFQTW